MLKAFKKENRVLLAELVRTDFKLRYQGSVLGYAWSLLRPLLLFLILYIVFAKFLRLGSSIPNYPIYLLLGIVLWQFFADMTNQSLGSIVERGDLIRKIRIPRWLIIVSSSISALINLTLNLIVVFIFMTINHTDLLVTSLWFPLLLIEVYVFGLGLSLILATAFVKYRDVSYIWEVVLQAGFYATPILYPLGLITNQLFQKLLLLNPMAQVIQDARYTVVTHETLTINGVFGTYLYTLIPVGLSFAFLAIGLLYFRKEAKNFAE
ncbi:MAG TPA: ABC transporter permease, partial [Candidatus Saccharimonadales bacterium]|nr:ABC transporter permease [Candidatus Saccharimonadales bacterium]